MVLSALLNKTFPSFPSLVKQIFSFTFKYIFHAFKSFENNKLIDLLFYNVNLIPTFS